MTVLPSLQNMIDQTVAFGQIDVLVNNAGKSNPYQIEDTTEEGWEFTVDTDLRSQFFGCLRCADGRGLGHVCHP